MSEAQHAAGNAAFPMLMVATRIGCVLGECRLVVLAELVANTLFDVQGDPWSADRSLLVDHLAALALEAKTEENRLPEALQNRLNSVIVSTLSVVGYL